MRSSSSRTQMTRQSTLQALLAADAFHWVREQLIPHGPAVGGRHRRVVYMRSFHAAELTLSAKLKYAALAVESVGCLVAGVKGLLGSIETFGLSLAVSALGCASTLVDAAVLFGLDDDPELASSRNAAGNIASAIGCATQTNPFDCLALALKAIANQLESFEAAQRELIDQFSINGSVIDGTNRKTMPVVPIRVFIDGQLVTERGTSTDGGGQFKISSLPPNMLVTLQVSLNGYEPASVEVQVGADAHTEIVLERSSLIPSQARRQGLRLRRHPARGRIQRPNQAHLPRAESSKARGRASSQDALSARRTLTSRFFSLKAPRVE